MTAQRKPSVAFWIIATLIGVPLLYVASFGPACWITSRTRFGAPYLPTLYRPILAAWTNNDTAIRWYVQVGSAEGSVWMTDGSSDTFFIPVPYEATKDESLGGVL